MLHYRIFLFNEIHYGGPCSPKFYVKQIKPGAGAVGTNVALDQLLKQSLMSHYPKGWWEKAFSHKILPPGAGFFSPLEFTGHQKGWITPKRLKGNLCLEEKTHFPEFFRDSQRETIPHLASDNSLSMAEVSALPPGCNSKRITVWDHGFLPCQNPFTTKYWILSPKCWILPQIKGVPWRTWKCGKANAWSCRVLKGEGLIFTIDPNQQHCHCSIFSWKSCSKSHGHPLDLSPPKSHGRIPAASFSHLTLALRH